MIRVIARSPLATHPELRSRPTSKTKRAFLLISGLFLQNRLLNIHLTRLYLATRLFYGNWHRLCDDWRVDKSRTYRRRRRSQIEFVWIQLEELIEHGKNKNTKTKLELMQRIYELLAKTQPKTKREKKR
jgi:hypothetical protein